MRRKEKTLKEILEWRMNLGISDEDVFEFSFDKEEFSTSTERKEMYIADNHVSDMLWNMKEHSVTPGGVMEYHIPNGLGNNGGTIIVGEWVEYTKKDGEQNMFFLVHSWDNEEAII